MVSGLLVFVMRVEGFIGVGTRHRFGLDSWWIPIALLGGVIALLFCLWVGFFRTPKLIQGQPAFIPSQNNANVYETAMAQQQRQRPQSVHEDQINYPGTHVTRYPEQGYQGTARHPEQDLQTPAASGYDNFGSRGSNLTRFEDSRHARERPMTGREPASRHSI